MLGNLVLTRETSFPRAVYEDARRDEIRLFHSPLIIDDDGDEEVCFEPDDDIEDEPNDSMNNDVLLLQKPTSLSRSASRTPSREVLAIIENLEKALDDEVEALSSDKNPCVSRLSGLKGVMNRIQKYSKGASGGLDKQPEPDKALDKTLTTESENTDAPPVAPTIETSTAGPKSAWTCIFRMGRRRKRNKKKKRPAGDQVMLIPNHFKDSEWGPSDDPSQSKSSTKDLQGTRNLSKTKQRKRHHLLQRLLQRRRPLINMNQTSYVADQYPDLDLYQERTRSISFWDEEDDHNDDRVDEKDSQDCPQQNFRNDEELIDRLVKVSDENASLDVEEGLFCLQERIRSRSSHNAPNTPMSAQDSRAPMFSASFLEAPSLFIPSVSNQFSVMSGHERDPSIASHNESIPSVSSLEDFLCSVNDSDQSAASLEALLFEQELEKLTSEELAQLLDSELEKLLLEGIA
ncbi:expressed unknown protein [Seminavis robusta]|uniref:Uncharacterized protein n=1 Tax=Seminavis robusta TaxID=568900 RepID=A0A9N8DN04_9STRA|nr:expressed unknown protein [Seminavis robusta]|eukprot:Sro169_g075250.1 n/a (460) ;mRNA; r:90673-92052